MPSKCKHSRKSESSGSDNPRPKKPKNNKSKPSKKSKVPVPDSDDESDENGPSHRQRLHLRKSSASEPIVLSESDNEIRPDNKEDEASVRCDI